MFEENLILCLYPTLLIDIFIIEDNKNFDNKNINQKKLDIRIQNTSLFNYQ